MSSAGRVLLGVTKWVLIPAALGFAGYYFIGPQFSKTAPVELRERVASALSPEEESGPKFEAPQDVEEKVSTKFKPPTVKVSVLPADGRRSDSESSVRPRRRARRTEAPTTPTTVPSEPEVTAPEPTSEPAGDSSQ